MSSWGEREGGLGDVPCLNFKTFHFVHQGGSPVTFGIFLLFLRCNHFFVVLHIYLSYDLLCSFKEKPLALVLS